VRKRDERLGSIERVHVAGKAQMKRASRSHRPTADHFYSLETYAVLDRLISSSSTPLIATKSKFVEVGA